MVKGISRQVIVVHSPDKKLFDQAIFILNDNVVKGEGITDEMLLREAGQAVRGQDRGTRKMRRLWGPAWACCGALLTGIVWLVTMLF